MCPLTLWRHKEVTTYTVFRFVGFFIAFRIFSEKIINGDFMLCHILMLSTPWTLAFGRTVHTPVQETRAEVPREGWAGLQDHVHWLCLCSFTGVKELLVQATAVLLCSVLVWAAWCDRATLWFLITFSLFGLGLAKQQWFVTCDFQPALLHSAYCRQLFAKRNAASSKNAEMSFQYAIGKDTVSKDKGQGVLLPSSQASICNQIDSFLSLQTS